MADLQDQTDERAVDSCRLTFLLEALPEDRT
jgi:hypothetical protein